LKSTPAKKTISMQKGGEGTNTIVHAEKKVMPDQRKTRSQKQNCSPMKREETDQLMPAHYP